MVGLSGVQFVRIPVDWGCGLLLEAKYPFRYMLLLFLSLCRIVSERLCAPVDYQLLETPTP